MAERATGRNGKPFAERAVFWTAVFWLGGAGAWGWPSAAAAHPPEEKPPAESQPGGDNKASGSRPGHGDAGERKGALPRPADLLPRGLLLPAVEGPKPWSDKPVLNDPNRFQIAIMTDNTGGHRPGVWMKAVTRLNLMRPEFVMSIGDLIEGYSTDRAKVEAEWKEFLGFVDKMEMRFFFVAGNHDVANPLMHQVWREHFGPEWYSFDYKDVHFLCLSSEDPETRIGEAQLAWIAADLEKHKGARWTLVFLHRPLWVDAEKALAQRRPDKTNWKRVEELLGARPHTVFSGHVHHYVQYDRNGMKYYHLGTTGGASQLRGIPYGEFDHVTWLTMESDGPRVANLLLDGMLPPDVVTEHGIARFREFLAKTQLEAAPILVDDDGGLSQGRIDLRLVNKFDARVEFSGRISGLPLKGLSVEPAELRLAAAPGQTSELAVTVQFGEKIAFPRLARTVLTGTIQGADTPPLSADVSVPVIIDRKYPLPRRDAAVVVDGNLDEWKDLPLATSERPLILGNAAHWQGPADAALRFAVAYDEKFLYVAARVADDAVVAGDELWVRLDGRGMVARKNDSRLREGTYRARLAAPAAEGTTELTVEGFGKATPPPGAAAAARRAAGGYEAELALPIEMLARNQNANWQSAQLVVVVHDVDEQGQAPARVAWRGTADLDRRNTNFGQFVRTP